jgi:hypothetical protein
MLTWPATDLDKDALRNAALPDAYLSPSFGWSPQEQNSSSAPVEIINAAWAGGLGRHAMYRDLGAWDLNGAFVIYTVTRTGLRLATSEVLPEHWARAHHVLGLPDQPANRGLDLTRAMWVGALAQVDQLIQAYVNESKLIG